VLVAYRSAPIRKINAILDVRGLVGVITEEQCIRDDAIIEIPRFTEQVMVEEGVRDHHRPRCSSVAFLFILPLWTADG